MLLRQVTQLACRVVLCINIYMYAGIQIHVKVLETILRHPRRLQ